MIQSEKASHSHEVGARGVQARWKQRTHMCRYFIVCYDRFAPLILFFPEIKGAVLCESCVASGHCCFTEGAELQVPNKTKLADVLTASQGS